MKRVLISVASVLSIVSVFSQTNFSFTDDDMQWSYITEETEEMASVHTPSIETTTYKYFGDSVVNGITYKKMFKSTDNELTWNELGLVREVEKRVYFISREKDSEELIYRFDYELYDKPLRWFSNKDSLPRINYIDEVSIADSQKKRFGMIGWGEEDIDVCPYKERMTDMLSTHDLYSFTDCEVEDIGSLYSPSFDYLPCSYNWAGGRYYTYLLCVKKGDEIIYHNPSYEECYYHRTAIEEPTSNNVVLSPNPVSDILYINNANGNPEYSIVNINGTIVWKGTAENNQINVSPLPAGVYFLKVGNEGMYRFVKK